MRKGIAIALLVPLLFFTAGYHLLFFVRIAEAKAEMKEAIVNGRPENLTKLQFSTNVFKAINPDGGSEFEYAGELYDVIKAEPSGKDVVVWCLSDKKEKDAVDAYLKTQKQSSQNNSSTDLAKLLSLPFVSVAILQILPFTQTVSHHNSFYQFSIPDCCSVILLPPPKAC